MPLRIAVFARLKNNLYLALFCLPAFYTSGVAPAAAEAAYADARIAIIVDDIGNNLPLGRRAVRLPGAITYAVLPHTPLASRLSEEALLSDPSKEVVIHMPMQAKSGRRLGPGGLLEAQPKDEFLATVRAALQAVPVARGLSNHMGSHLTTLPDRMHWLMTELGKNGFFYIDSKTVVGNRSPAAALATRVPYLARDIFLDHDRDPGAIAAAFERAVRLARRDGLAVLIAHPYRNTLDFLENRLPQLPHEGVSLVNASTALALRNRQQKLALGDAPNAGVEIR